MNLNEQIYSNLNRNYYYGTVNKQIFSSLKPSLGLFSDPDEEKLLWLTTNVLYAMDYAGFNWETSSGHKEGKIYICNFTEPFNIFNANAHRDYIRMIRKSGEDEFFNSDQIRGMQHEDFFILGKEFRKRIIKYARELGYQGIFNYEHGSAYAPSIGLFDTSELKIKEVILEKDFSTRFEKQIANGDKRAIKGLLESQILSEKRARELSIPLSLLKEHSKIIPYLDID